MELLFTTNPGLEDIVEREISYRLQVDGLEVPISEIKPFGFQGHILSRVTCPIDDIRPIILQMRSIHHTFRIIQRFSLPEANAIETIRSDVRKCEIPEMYTARSFRVTSERKGTHSFTSMDVARASGAALIERHECPVDLENYDLNVQVDVFNQTCLVSLQLTRDSLNRRHKQIYNPRIGLQPIVAYSMLSLADLEGKQGALLDPFCGGGTILLEAAEVFPRLDIYGSDANQHTITGAQKNADATGLADRIHLQRCRAQNINRTYSETRFRAIVTNPPFGVGLGRHLNFYWLYRDFLMEAQEVLEPDGSIVILVWQRGLFNQVLNDLDIYHICHERTIETGRLHPCIFVLKQNS